MILIGVELIMVQNNWLDLGNKKVLLAGAGGFGSAILKAFLEEGASVYCVDKSIDQIKKEKLEAKSINLFFESREISSQQDCSDVVNNAKASMGAIDIFIYSIGINNRLPIEKISTEVFRQIQLANVEICLWLAQSIYPIMREQRKGKMVFFSSVSAFLAHPNHGGYAASKGAMNQLLKVMAIEWAKDGINVNAVAPGYAETPLTADYLNQGNHFEDLVRKVPMGRLAVVNDVVGPVLFLSSKRSDYVTGQVLVIDGGRTLD